MTGFKYSAFVAMMLCACSGSPQGTGPQILDTSVGKNGLEFCIDELEHDQNNNFFWRQALVGNQCRRYMERDGIGELNVYTGSMQEGTLYIVTYNNETQRYKFEKYRAEIAFDEVESPDFGYYLHNKEEITIPEKDALVKIFEESKRQAGKITELNKN